MFGAASDKKAETDDTLIHLSPHPDPLMDLATSKQRKDDPGLGRTAFQAGHAWAQRVFVETEPRLRIEPIDPNADLAVVLTQRRPDLLLISAAALITATACGAQESAVTALSPARHRNGISTDTSSGVLKIVLAALREYDRQLPVIVSVPDEEQAGQWTIEAIQAGAIDVVSSTTPAERLHEKIRLAIQRRRLQRRPTVRIADSAARQHPDIETTKAAVIGTSDVMLSVFCRLARFAAEPVPLLIHGEPGTGKSHLALSLHRHTRGAGEQPQFIDCGQFAADHLDRLLFDDTAGAVQLRDNFRVPSLILENVDQAGARVQRRLLAAIRQRASPLPHPASRAAPACPPALVMTCSTVVNTACYDTHTGSTGECRSGLIPELLFELAGDAIELPPLRDRGSDISRFIEHFICALTGTAPVDATSGEHRISDEAKAALEGYHWPGNVTQLRSLLSAELRLGGGTIVLSERLVKLTGRPVVSPRPLPSLDPPTPTSLPSDSNQPQPELNSPRAWTLAVERFVESGSASEESSSLYGETIQAVEAGLITAVLEKTQGNLAQAARLLGITRVSLRRKIHSLGLSIPGRTD